MASNAPTAQVEAGEIAAAVLRMVVELAKPGVSGAELDQAAEQAIRDRSGVPAFKGYRGYGATLCLSIDEQVVHGIPGERTLEDGDLVSLDLRVKLGGYYVDTAVTINVGTPKSDAERLRQVTEAALGIALREARAGNTTGDLGAAVDAYVTEQGFTVVRDCVGHGIGRNLHEEPSIPNYGKKGKGSRFSAGQLVAIEPMVVTGSPELKLSEDRWTLSTEDGGLAAHAEETVLVTDGDPVRLTPVTASLDALSGEKAGARVTKAAHNAGSR